MTATRRQRGPRRPVPWGQETVQGAVGLLAGEGRLPEVLARAVRARGRPLVCVQMAGQTPVLERLANVFARLAPEQWGELEALWLRHAVSEVLLAGRFRRAEMVARLLAAGSDLRGFLQGLPERGDQQVLDALARRLATQGIRVLDQLAYIPDLVPPPGLLAGPPLTPGEERDVRIGLAVGRALAAHEVGQTVVLKHGAILAVEAAEGTDEAIRRGTAMVPGAVVVKVSRPQQDPRFDLPTVGPETVEAMRQGRARVLAVEARRTIVLERPRLAARAEEAGISVFAVEAPPLRPQPAKAP